MIATILSIIIGAAIMGALSYWANSHFTPPPTDDDTPDDWGGGSDRNKPVGPWWPPGVSTEPMRERELV